MGLQGNRLKAETGAVYVQILVRDEEYGTLPGCPQATQTGHLDGFLCPEIFFKSVEEDFYKLFSRLEVGPIGLGIEFGQKIVFALPVAERQLAVRRVDSVTFVRERRRYHLGDERTDSGQSNFIIVKNQVLDHLGKEGDIHAGSFRIEHKDT